MAAVRRCLLMSRHRQQRTPHSRSIPRSSRTAQPDRGLNQTHRNHEPADAHAAPTLATPLQVPAKLFRLACVGRLLHWPDIPSRVPDTSQFQLACPCSAACLSISVPLIPRNVSYDNVGRNRIGCGIAATIQLMLVGKWQGSCPIKDLLASREVQQRINHAQNLARRATPRP